MSLQVSTEQARQWIPQVQAGEEILLSGVLYTARDAAHKRFAAAIESGQTLPFPIRDAFLYYAGPTPTRPGQIIGACGPTTSSRMDPYAPTLYRLGLAGTIGKGERSSAVQQAIVQTGGIYLCAIGGAGALAAQAIREVSVIAYPELGCESVKRLVLCDFPLLVGIDCHGRSLFPPK